MADNSSPTHAKQLCGICGSRSNSAAGSTLSKCKGCKQPFYCSKECQRKDWPTHKITCKLLANPSHLHKGVQMIHLKPGVDKHAFSFPAVLIYSLECPAGSVLTPFSFAGVAMQGQEGRYPGDIGFTELPVTKAIGYPLGIKGMPSNGMPGPNHCAAVLDVDMDPKNATYGEMLPWRIHLGGVALARTDGRHTKVLPVQAICEYMKVKLQEVFEFKVRQHEGKEKGVDLQEFVESLFTPAAFSSAFEVMRQKARGREEGMGRC
ncbi:hypothetical protein LTS10_010160 [Elasticomyces elasticus]|nr:hypothetical protein LTS10_010160 [Elasticomyces elasticus]